MISTPLTPVRNVRQLELDVQRIAAALLDDALARLNSSADPGKTVHEARKRIKELRALLRLLHPALVDHGQHPIRPRDNDRLRAAADCLAEARDAEVVIHTLDSIAKGLTAEAGPPDLAPVRQQLVRRRQQAATPDANFKSAAGLLQSVRHGIPQWRIHGRDHDDAWSAIAPGLRRLYRRGRRTMHAATSATDATDEPGDPVPWHDWRRRAKDLRYALELLRASAPPLLTGAAEAAKHLTDHLGEDHDLAVLLQTLRDAEPPMADEAVIVQLTGIVATRRAGLQAQARKLGACLYVEVPSAFARRLRGCWRSAAE